MEEMHERSSYWAGVSASALLYGCLLALAALDLSTATPVWGIDSSFRVGLTEAVLHHLKFGVDVVWPYGPLGFLAGPTIINRGLLALAICYQFGALAVLFTALIVHLRRLGLGSGWMAGILVPYALAISVTDNIVPELVAVAVLLALIVSWRDDRDGIAPRNWWLLSLNGVAAGSLVLVKFGPGLFACMMVGWFALASRARLHHVPATIVLVAVGFLVPWFATGQTLAALPSYIATSLELSTGYQDSQAWAPEGGRMLVVGLLTVVAVVIGGFGAWRLGRIGRRKWLVLVPLTLMLWFTLKQGFVRWDPWHANGALLIVGLLVLAIRWEKKFVLLPIGVLVSASVVALANAPARLKSTWPDRAGAALAVLSTNQQARELEAARVDVRASYAVPGIVVDALKGVSVHAESWDINAVWANGLAWQPLPNLQSYSAYTALLDRINAADYASSSGPGGVLLNPASTDSRYALWESPDARVALTCNFVPVAAGGEWTALRRAPDACGSAVALRTVTARAGEKIRIPEPSSPEQLVVARFALPPDPIARILTSIAKPPRYAGITLDGVPHRLLLGTAQNAHLVRSPGVIGQRKLAHGRVQHSELVFWNVGSGEITVRFEQIPLQAL